MTTRTKSAAWKGAKIGGAIGAIRGGVGIARYGASGGKNYSVAAGMGLGAVVTHGAVGAAAAGGYSAYKQHKENAHLHNFHTSVKSHTM